MWDTLQAEFTHRTTAYEMRGGATTIKRHIQAFSILFGSYGANVLAPLQVDGALVDRELT